MSGNNSNSSFGLALLWPFAGLISALKNWRKPWAKNVFGLICAFMGAIHIYQPADTMLCSSKDGGHYVLNLQQYHESGLT